MPEEGVLIKPVKDTYKGSFFKNRHKLSWRCPVVCEAIIQTYNLMPFKQPFPTVIDVGCGIGDYVAWFNQNGVKSQGIEGSEAAKEFFVSDDICIWDLRISFDSLYGRKASYDVVMSLEVAEHIEPEYVNDYVDNLCSLGNQILISAASPGQKGHGHVNCQPRSYWEGLFFEKGYIADQQHEELWRHCLLQYKHKKELSSYYKNAICFRKVGE